MKKEIRRRKPKAGKDLTLREFDNLVCLHEHGYQGYHRVWWCRCKCGKELPVLATNLLRRYTKSCGCLNGKGHNSWNWEGCGDISGGRWSRIKYGAVSRDIEFAVTIEYAWLLFQEQNGKCALSGLPISLYNHVSGEEGPASLDRIDSSKGYIEGNVQWVHKDINRMKQTFEQGYFIELCRAVTQNSVA